MSEPLTPNSDEAALAKVKYAPYDPIGSPGSLKALLERNQGAIAALLPKHVTPERLIKTLLVAANRNPDLLKCTQASLIEGIQRAAELGLDLSGTMGEAYLVPFNNKLTINGREVTLKQATFIPGYRGLAKLAWQSGEVSQIDAEPVHQFDEFIYEKGTDPKCVFKPKLNGERGDVIGFYSLARLRNGGVMTDYMTRADVEKVRQNAVSKNSPAWNKHFDEMGRKTVFRRLSKWLPMSSDKFKVAIEQDNLDFDMDALMPTIDVVPSQLDAFASAGALPAGPSSSQVIDITGTGSAQDPILVQAQPAAATAPSASVAGPGSDDQAGAATPAQAEPSASAGQTVGVSLTTPQVVELKAAIARAGLSLDAVEGYYGASLADITIKGLDSKGVEADIVKTIKDMAAAAKPASAPVFLSASKVGMLRALMAEKPAVDEAAVVSSLGQDSGGLEALPSNPGENAQNLYTRVLAEIQRLKAK